MASEHKPLEMLEEVARLKGVGDKKRRVTKFIADHPTCCYCGIAATETEDHFPPRASFMRRVWPEGFVFPACDACNAELRDEEQVFAFYVRCLDQDDRTFDQDQFVKLKTGMENNFPDLMPDVNVSAITARRLLRQRGVLPEPGKLLTEMGITLIPAGLDAVINKIAAKLTKALHYHATGRILPREMHVYSRWFDFMHPDAAQGVEAMTNIFPTLTIGARSNTDIYEQFAYKSGKANDGEAFGFIAQFSRALFIPAIAIRGGRDTFEKSEGWARVL